MDILINTHGASQYGAAAIVGNMLSESGLIVDRLEISLFNMNKSWEGGISLVQWTGSRRTEFEKFFGIANNKQERKELIGINNKNVSEYQKLVREKVSFEAAINYYWNELTTSIKSDLKSVNDAKIAAEIILADLRPGDYLCWSLWDSKGATTYCTKNQKTKVEALSYKNIQRDNRLNDLLNAYEVYNNNNLA